MCPYTATIATLKMALNLTQNFYSESNLFKKKLSELIMVDTKIVSTLKKI